MKTKLCAACGNPFEPWPQIRDQQFCSAPDCQRERRRRQQAAKRAKNPATRETDVQYYKDWSAKNPGYWKKYRADHPEYAERNRNQQKKRNGVRIAKDYQSCHKGRGDGEL